MLCLGNALAEYTELDTHVLTSNIATSQGVHRDVVFFPIMEGWGITSLWRLVKTLRNTKPDIVHIQYPTVGYWFAPGKLRALTLSLLPLVSYLSGCRVVQTWHEYEDNKLGTWPFFYFLLRAFVPSDIVVVRRKFRTYLPPFAQRLLKNRKICFIQGASAMPVIDMDTRECAALRQQTLGSQKRLLVFFGFITPHKGTDLLFEIADPERDYIIIMGGYDPNAPYTHDLMQRIASTPWLGKAELTGFASQETVSKFLSAADAVILPFRNEGVGEWNSSYLAARSHGCFTVTTSKDKNGFDSEENTYYAKVDDVTQMRNAIDLHAGSTHSSHRHRSVDEWQRVAMVHESVYRQTMPTEFTL